MVTKNIAKLIVALMITVTATFDTAGSGEESWQPFVSTTQAASCGSHGGGGC